MQNIVIKPKKHFLDENDLFEKISHLNTYKGSEPISPNCDKNLKMYDCGWSLPNKKALDEIFSFVGSGGKILEVAAGLGLWSAAMKFRDLNVMTTGLMITHHSPGDEERIWTEIEMIDAFEAVKKYSDYKCLFLSWGRCLLHEIVKEFKGNKLIVVCEYVPGLGGCTDMLDAYSEEDLEKISDNESDRESCRSECGFKFVKCLDVRGQYRFYDKICFYERDDSQIN